MGDQKKSEDLKLDFGSYIKEFFPEYHFDEHNRLLIKNLGLWAIRSEKFNNIEPGWHINRGILLVGAPGVGKDFIMRILRKYISYLRSPYGYGHRVVWDYAKEFQKDKVGYACFDGDKGNMYYEELALTDEGSNPITCSRENVQHFGNKLLIGRELISVRYNHFVNFGWHTHFSSNCNEAQMEKLYGVRAVDRLREMCNYVMFKGDSKRGRVAPQFVRDTNVSAPPPARETTVDEHKENKRVLELEYQNFLKDGAVSKDASLHYYLLKSYGCNLGTDDDMRLLMELAAPNYQAPASRDRSATHTEHKRDWVWSEAKKLAVGKFYQGLKDGGAATIFGEVNVPVEALVGGMVSHNKSQTS